MGLFSFIKNAGAKIFKKKETAAPKAAAAPVMTEEQMDIQALTAEVTKLDGICLLYTSPSPRDRG